jgi:hypothetical protein
VESLGLTSEELNEIGAKIGMDVPFFLSGHEVALGTHYGERISPLTPLPQNLHIVIEFTGHDVSTPEAYAHWDEAQEAKLVPHKPAVSLHNIVIKTTKDLEKIPDDPMQLCKLLIKSGLDIDANQLNRPNVVKHNSFHSKKELEFMLTEDLFLSEDNVMPVQYDYRQKEVFSQHELQHFLAMERVVFDHVRSIQLIGINVQTALYQELAQLHRIVRNLLQVFRRLDNDVVQTDCRLVWN